MFEVCSSLAKEMGCQNHNYLTVLQMRMMTIPKLYGNLLTYELELAQRMLSNSEQKKKENIVALQARVTFSTSNQRSVATQMIAVT